MSATQVPSPSNGKGPNSPLSQVDGADGDTPSSAFPFDFKSLTRQSLAAVLAQAYAETEQRTEMEIQAHLASEREHREAARTLGVTLARLRAARDGKAAPKPPAGTQADGRAVVLPKYRNPANPSQTWSGRGAAPPWIEFSGETLPPRKPGGEPRKVPLAKFRIPEPEGEDKE